MSIRIHLEQITLGWHNLLLSDDFFVRITSPDAYRGTTFFAARVTQHKSFILVQVAYYFLSVVTDFLAGV